MNKELSKWTEHKFMILKRKAFISSFWFYFINILSIFIIAALVVLNLYAIKMNKLNPDVKELFVYTAILTACAGFFTSLITFFTLRKNSTKYTEKHNKIKQEYLEWKKSVDKYEDKKEKNHILLNTILEIIEEE